MKDINAIMEEQREFFNSGETKQLTFRKQQLGILRKAIQEKEADILETLKKDLNKSAFEAYETEVGIVLEELKGMLKNIDKLYKTKRVKTPMMHFLSTSKIYNEPYGIVLIMSPWNYPLGLRRGKHMKIEQTSFFVGDTTLSASNEKTQNEKEMKEKNGSYFAGNLKQNADPIAARREEAVNKALKVVKNAFDGEKKVDEDLQLRTDHIKELEYNMAKAKDSIENIKDSREVIKETYGVTEDSKEQGDLELLEKRYCLQNKSTGEILTEQEQDHLKEIDQAGLTEYQNRSLELYKQEDTFKKEIDESLSEIQVENAVIRGVKLEGLKTNPILEATQAADKIKTDASEEIKGMLVSEMKDHIDEVKKKQQEEAEKKEKAEEDAKKTETNQEKSNENDQVENIIKLPAIKKEVQTEIENIIDKMNLLGEDILGAVVDTNL